MFESGLSWFKREVHEFGHLDNEVAFSMSTIASQRTLRLYSCSPQKRSAKHTCTDFARQSKPTEATRCSHTGLCVMRSILAIWR